MNPLEARRRLLGRNVYKRTTEGNPAIAQGSLARMYPGITMQGWTEQDSTTGANLFDKSTVIKNKYINDSTGEMYDKAEGDTSASDYVLVRGLSYIRVTTTTFAQWMAFYDINKDFISGINGYGKPIQVPQNAEYARFTIPNPVVDTFMVNAGSELLPWEPYTGRKPSPSPDYPQEIVSAGKYNEDTQKWEYEVKLTGANLFDAKKYVELNSEYYEIGPNGGVIQTYSDGRVTGTVPVVHTLPPGTFYIRGDKSNGQVIIDGVSFSTSAPGRYVILTLEKETDIAYKFCVGSNTSYPSEEYFPMVSRVQDATYEPYRTPQTVTLTADRPLTKWDKLEKRSGQWGWVYKSNEIVLDGNEQFNTLYPPYVVFPEVEKGVTTAPPSGYPYRDIYSNYSYTLRWSNSSCLTIALGLDTHAFDSVDAFKTWLRQKYSEGKPFKYCYETEAETFIPLTESEQEAMNALHTFRPTTVLSNDCDCNMTLTYKTKKSLEVAT